MAQFDDFSLGKLGVRDDLPGFHGAGFDRHAGVDQEGAANASLDVLRIEIHAVLEAIDLVRGNQDARRIEAQAVGDVRFQRFAWFCAVGNAGEQCEHCQARGRIKLRPLVRIDEIA